jgi:PAS domain S-box-containing protein
MFDVSWEKIADEALAGIFIIKGNKFVYVNKVVERATKYTKDELYSMESYFELVYDKDRKIIERAIKEVEMGKESFYEVRYVRKDKKIRWAWGFMKPIVLNGDDCILGNWIDVTQAKILEDELKDSEEFFRTLIADSLSPVYVIKNGKFIYVNDVTCRLTGYNKEELLSMDPFQLIHPDFRDEVIRKYTVREKGLRGTEVYSWKIITKNGEERWITAKPQRIILKGEYAVSASIMDTTEIHRVNEELKRRNEYLSFLNKILRHDILNDLNVVIGVLEMHKDELSKKVLKRVHRMVELIKETRGLEQAGNELKPINLSEIVAEVVESYRNFAEIESELENVWIKGNESLKSAISNVIQNSLKHSNTEELIISVKLKKDGEKAILEIKDNGIGFRNEIKEEMFKEGFTTGQGTGLGLYITKKIIELHGGNIRAENDGTGAKFIMEFPYN